MNKTLKFVSAVVVSELAGAIGSVFTVPSIPTWYAALNKSALNPPSWVFGPVWTALFFLMGISLYLVWSKDWKVSHRIWEGGKRAWNRYSERLWTGSWQKANVIAIFSIQLFLNTFWPVLFFGLKTPGFAFFELLALWFAIIYTIINFYRISKPAAYLLIPYLLWVSFAGYLNYAVWMMN